MKKANQIAKELDLTAAPTWGATYEYDPAKRYENRDGEQVWTWWPKGDSFSGTHFTIWNNDVNDKNGLLKRFHITFNYNNQSYKPVHVYYNLRGARPVYSNVDANRAGADAGNAEDYVNRYANSFDELAWKFVKAAVWD